jgi:hypothetical protein
VKQLVLLVVFEAPLLFVELVEFVDVLLLLALLSSLSSQSVGHSAKASPLTSSPQ